MAIKARVTPLKAIGIDLLSSAIRVYKAFWPGTEVPIVIEELTRCIQKTKDRLREWRASAARAGADEVLQFVLSWYEGINLEVLKTMRRGSKWSENEECVALRKEHAYRLASYAETKGFIEGLPEPETEDEEEEGSEDEGSEVEEEVDEENEEIGRAHV